MNNWEEILKGIIERGEWEAKGTPLKYEKYKDYCKEGPTPGQWLFKFENGYGASVIKHFGSYGYEEDKFELAVIRWTEGKHYELEYNTPITNDVIGHLDNKEVMDLLEQIKELKERE